MEERTFATIEEYRAWARADAISRGTTVEQEVNEIERDIGCEDYCDLLRELHGLKQSPLEYILSLTDEEKRELVRLWKERKEHEEC